MRYAKHLHEIPAPLNMGGWKGTFAFRSTSIDFQHFWVVLDGFLVPQKADTSLFNL